MRDILGLDYVHIYKEKDNAGSLEIERHFILKVANQPWFVDRSVLFTYSFLFHTHFLNLRPLDRLN